MKIHVVGAGAIGGVVAAHLVRAGKELTIVDANAAHVKAIQDYGLTINGFAEIRVPVRALLPHDLQEQLDVVFLAVKSRHTDEAMRTIAPLLSDEGYVVSLQNGMEEQRIADWVGASRVVGALLTFGGHYEEPGKIRYMGPGTFLLGELDGSASERVALVAEFLAADFHPTKVTNNIQGALWSKAAIGAAYFATALVDVDVPVIFSWPEYRPVFERLVKEVVLVARAEAVQCVVLDGFDPNAFAAEICDPAQAEKSWQAQYRYWSSHGEGRTGVWRDLAVHRRPTEVDWIVGPVVERGKQHGVGVVLLERLVELVHEAESGMERSTAGWLNELLSKLQLVS
jgi:2-dehydropantoate 2-reductase